MVIFHSYVKLPEGNLTHTIYLTGVIFLYGRLVEYPVQSSKTIRKLG